MRFLPLVVFISFVFFLVGFGGRGPETFTSIPVPERSFSAEISDRMGVTVDVSMFSWEGQVYFAGYRGAGVFTVSFDRVDRAEFGKVGTRGRVPVRLYMKDGSVFEMEMDADKYFYGRTTLGNYRIRVGKVRFIRFL